MSSLFNFTDKVALITGSSSGIGAAIATQLAQYGATVVITGRDSVALEKVAQIIQEKSKDPSKQKILQIVGNLLDQSFAPKLIEQTVDNFGRIDFLVNNAGGGSPSESFEATDLMEQYDGVMNLNVRSVLQLTQLAVPYLEQNKGSVLNISSIASTLPHGLCYATSKAALDMLTRTSAGLLASKGIRVNSINPGPVYTAAGRSIGMPNYFKEQEENLKAITPLNRIAEPEEIGHLAAYLLSNLARNITGSIVVSDGGILIKTH